MVVRPAAIVIINNDITSNIQDMLVRQLHISEVLDGYVFDARIAADSNYIHKIKQLDIRVLVKRSLEELDNRQNADVVGFVSHGLFSVLKNNFGPPGKTLRVVNLYWGNIGVFGPP